MTTKTPSPYTALVGMAIGLISLVIIAMLVASSLLGQRPTVEHNQTTPDQYCALAQTKTFTELVDVAVTNPSYTSTVLAMMPNNGPPAVADNLFNLRSELAQENFLAAHGYATKLDAQTVEVCP